MPKTYYVSTSNGNDSNNGSEGKPFKTIQAGVNKASDGDTVLIRAGVYSETVQMAKLGNPSKPVRIASYDNETAILDGSDFNLGAGGQLIRVTQCRNLTLAGLEIRNTRGRGIFIEDSKDVLVKDCEINNCHENGMFVQDSDQITVDGCRVHQCAMKIPAAAPESTTKAVMFRRCKDVKAVNNTLYENMDAGLATLYVRNVEFSHNTLYDNRNGQIIIASSRDVLINRNFCYHTGREEYLDLTGDRPPGIMKRDRERYADSGVWHTQDVQCVNNIIAGCGNGLFVEATGGQLTGFTMGHNTIVNPVQAAIAIESPLPNDSTTFENNLVAARPGIPLVHMANPSGAQWRHNFWTEYPASYAANPSSDVIDPNPGLIDINATLLPGQSTAEFYDLTEAAPAINRGRQSNVSSDFDGTARDKLPDMGAYEFDGTEPPDGGGEVVLPPAGTRVSKDLQTLYDFKGNGGDTVADVGGVGNPLNLTIRDAAAVKWGEDGLRIASPTLIRSQAPAAKVIAACKISNELTLEAWVKPASVNIDGQARIAGISKDDENRNMTLAQGLKDGQASDLYNLRLRTTNSSDNGIPSISSPSGSLTAEMTHVVFTRDAAGRAVLYVNGQERAVDRLSGNLSNWEDSFEFVLANELSGNGSWLGTYRLVATFSRALHPLEVEHNYKTGLPQPDTVEAAFQIRPGQEIGSIPHLVNFDSSESTAVSGIVSYRWDFGDGANSADASPAHTYTKAGVYTVSLAIADANGDTSTLTREQLITVTALGLPALPGDYARFVLADVKRSHILAFGTQYPDLRCVMAWNEDPNHIVIFRDVDDIHKAYVVAGSIELIWVDHPEEDLG